jgi:hypothetical protein
MKATLIKIENKKYRIISEEDYLSLLNDIRDLKKVLKRNSEKGMEVRAFYKDAKLYKKVNEAALEASINKGIEQLKKGLGRPHEEVMADLRKRYNL